MPVNGLKRHLYALFAQHYMEQDSSILLRVIIDHSFSLLNSIPFYNNITTYSFYNNITTYSLIFQFGAIWNSAAMNILVHVL